MLGCLLRSGNGLTHPEKQHVFFSAAQLSSWGRTAYETNPAGLSENLTHNCSRGGQRHVAWRLGLTCSKTLAFSLHTGRAKGS